MLEAPEPTAAPKSWKEFISHTRHPWARPFLYVDWLFAKAAWFLSKWSLLKLLAYVETFSVLVAMIFWVAEAKERKQQKHYQAWQVINTAQGKGGSGGRGDAMEQLNDDHVPLIGIDVADSFLQDIQLDKAELRRSNFRAADLRNAHFRKAALQDATLTSANLRGSDLRHADLTNASLTDTDLTNADLRSAGVRGASFDKADFRGADLSGLNDWKSIANIRLANIDGVKDPPEGFIAWALINGAVQMPSTEQWNALLAADAKLK